MTQRLTAVTSDHALIPSILYNLDSEIEKQKWL